MPVLVDGSDVLLDGTDELIDGVTITSPATFLVEEEGETEVATLTFTDPDGPGLFAWSTSGGADEEWFSIDPNTGVLSFLEAPDYETPTDLDGNNVYLVDVSVISFSSGITDTQSIQVTVTDASEASSYAGCSNVAISLGIGIGL